MTKAMALELGSEVRINSVCPGYVDTDMVRRDYLDQAKDPARAEAELLQGTPMGRGDISRLICETLDVGASQVWEGAGAARQTLAHSILYKERLIVRRSLAYTELIQTKAA